MSLPKQPESPLELKLPRILDRSHLGLPEAYLVNDEDLFTTYMPWTIQPLTETMQISGFMNDSGHIHYEFNHETFNPHKHLNFRSLINPARYYQALVREFLGFSLVGNEMRLIAGGHFEYNFKKKESFLMNLMIVPRRLIPDVNAELRRDALLLLQKSFDRLTIRLGGEKERTATLIIPDERMRAAGWVQVKPKGLKERWDRMREWWPISLRGMQRIYVKQLPRVHPQPTP